MTWPSRARRRRAVDVCAAFAGVTLLAVSAPPLAGWQTGAGSPSGAISGVVTDRESRRPVAGAVVHLGLQGQSAGGRISQQVTDARGRFVFDELAASSLYFLTASRAGYLEARYGQLPGMPTGPRITLADGQWLSDADIEMSRVGAIGGRVFDEQGEPVVAAFVRALLDISVGGAHQFATSLTTKTNDRGEYRLAGLVAGRYLVMLPSVQHTVPASATPAQVEGLRPDMMARLEALLAQGGSVPRLNNGAMADGSARLIIGNFVTPPPPVAGRGRAYPTTFHPGATDIASAIPIDVTAGADHTGVDIVLRPLPAVRVSGRVEGLTIASRLTLRLVPAGLDDLGAAGSAATTIVDADGAFTFLNVPSGTYTLDARQSFFELSARPMIGSIAGANLPPTPGRALLGRQIQNPINAGPPNTIYSAHLAPPTGFTTAAPGPATVVPSGVMFTAEPDRPGPSYFGRAPVSVGATDVTGVIVPLHLTSAIRGGFVYEDMPNGPPSRAPLVTAAAVNANRTLGLAASDNEGDLGPSTFEIHGVVPGSYRLLVSTRPTTVVKSIVVAGQDYATKPIDVAAGQDLASVTITLTDKAATLSGVARDPQGAVAQRAAVILFSTDRSVWPDLALATPWAKSTAVLAEGAYRFPALSAGDYFVAAVGVAQLAEWIDPAFLGKVAAVATRVSIGWGEARTIDLRVVTVK